MTRGFEELFPLPWRVRHNKFGTWVSPCILKIEDPKLKEAVLEGVLTVWQVSGDAKRYKAIQYKAIKYAATCANLMPEAVELLKYLRETMLEDASWVQIEGEEKCYSCDEELERIDNFLAKLKESVDV
ncbi:MAG: hypothetical protein RR340_08460 [Cloacibacillus sp.]